MTNVIVSIEELKEFDKKLAESQTRTEKIYQSPSGWIIEYKDLYKLADDQMHAFWPWDEPQVEDDIQDVRVKMSESENYANSENLKLFTHYEIRVGSDYWAERIMKNFPRPEISRAAAMFSAVEFNSHAPFYNRINELLFIDTEEFYDEWKNDPVLVERMNFIDTAVEAEDDLVSIAAFSFIEGAVLYSIFSFFKHFQCKEYGKNLIKNINRGMNQSVGDENIHAIYGAMLFNHVKRERNLSIEDKALLEKIVYSLAIMTFEHESKIVDLMFSKGELGGITEESMKDFIKHRVNLCLKNLGYDELFDENSFGTEIADWFYNDINSIQFHDLFTGSGSEYHNKWSEKRFGEIFFED